MLVPVELLVLVRTALDVVLDSVVDVDEVTLAVVLLTAALEDVLLDVAAGTPVPLPPHAVKSSEVASSPAGKMLRNSNRTENSFLSQQASPPSYTLLQCLVTSITYKDIVKTLSTGTPFCRLPAVLIAPHAPQARGLRGYGTHASQHGVESHRALSCARSTSLR